jgi:hypothetical protein
MAMSHAVYVTVASDEVYLALGGRRDVMLTVQNTGSSVEHYRLDVSGIPAECYDLDPPHLTLPASASAHVSLALHLPAGATSATGRYPVTVQVTSEDDPTHGASVGFVLIVDSGSGLDMDVQPAEATGRDATFQIAFLNQAPAPAVVALAARDSDDALCVHITPPDPVVVPPGATAALATVHVRPKKRRRGDRPQRYEIEFRGRRVESGPLSTPALVAHARFTYVPRPALLQRPAWLRWPAWLRRLPVSTLALMLTLLLVLLLQAYLATQPTVAPTAVPTPVLPTVAPRPSAAPVTDVGGDVPSIQSFTLVQPQPSRPYMLVWQTRNARSVTLNGRPVAPQGRLALSPPLASTTYQLVARRGPHRATAQVSIVLRPATSGTQARVGPATPGTRSFVLALPRIVTFALHRRRDKLFVVWQVRDAARVWLQTQAVPSSGEHLVPPGTSVLWLTARNAVGSARRSLQLPRTTATGTPIPTATRTPLPTPAASPPALVLIPDTLSFGTQDLHTTSAARDIHIVNLGPASLTVASVSITGTTPRDFSASDGCAGTTMRAYNGCTIRIRFTPSRSGPRRASLVIADNAADTPQIVPLSGNGGRLRR